MMIPFFEIPGKLFGLITIYPESFKKFLEKGKVVLIYPGGVEVCMFL